MKHLASNLESLKKWKWLLVISMGVFFIWFAFCLPSPLFNQPYSAVLFDTNQDLLGAKIAEDGQWRFPETKTVPLKFEKALLAFEDKRFYSHFGVDVLSLSRAVVQNVRNGRVVSGGSTLHMQLIRMAENHQSRSLWNKSIESILAIRLSLSFSKKEVLNLYASHAPFGGNVVGLNAASWRYYGKSADQLSWAQSATLAVLPNAPGLIHPARNRVQLEAKRNRLLVKLFEAGEIDSLSYELARMEPLPAKPLSLPRLAPHLLDHFVKTRVSNGEIHSSISAQTQKQVNQIASRHMERLLGNDVKNIGLIVMETRTGKVRAYLGNVFKEGQKKEDGSSVDMVRAARSSGSILKPLLYGKMISEGYLLPKQLIEDYPRFFRGYRPGNFSKNYAGLVPADEALSKSLNVPFVRLLQDYGLEKFHFDLNKMGISTLNSSAKHYGLTLILGGAEVSLWEMTGIYASMGRTLLNFNEQNSRYDPLDFHQGSLLRGERLAQKTYPTEQPIHFSAASIWNTFEAMEKVIRPSSSGDWELFEAERKIAWKTGTSFGFKDAWAIGVTPDYTVGVWVGNADGEGRPELIGVRAAAPVLFDVFKVLGGSGWFEAPVDDLSKEEVCKISGFKALDICPKDSVLTMPQGSKALACPYHEMVHLNEEETHQVKINCYDPSLMKSKPWMIVPPGIAKYYRMRSPAYEALPPFSEACEKYGVSKQPIQLIYPDFYAKIYLPIGFEKEREKTIFRAAHLDANAELFWHIDSAYKGSTKVFHEMAFSPEPGKHILTINDEQGYSIQQAFEILIRDKK